MKTKYQAGLVLCGGVALVLAWGVLAGAQEPKEETKLSINLSNLPVGALITYVSELTGKPVVLPKGFDSTEPVNIVAAETAKVPRDRLLSVIASALRQMKYVLVEDEELISLVPETTRKLLPVSLEAPHAVRQRAKDEVVRTVKDLKYADAGQLSIILSQLASKVGTVQAYTDANKLIITEYSTNLDSMLSLIESLDQEWVENECEVYNLKVASTTSLSKMVTNYVKDMTKASDPFIKKRMANLSVYQHRPTNSFVLFGHPDDVAQVKAFIAKLDVPALERAGTYHFYQVLNSDAAEMAKLLAGVVRARVEKGVKEAVPIFLADPATNTIIVVAPRDQYEELLPLMKQLDRKKAQVLIEAAIVELSTDTLLDIGVELATMDRPGDTARGFAATSVGISGVDANLGGRVPIPPPEGGITIGVFKDSAFNIPALVRLSLRDERISLVAVPSLMVIDNVTAEFEIADEQEWRKGVVTPEGRTSEVFHGGFIKAGIKLTITPHVSEGGYVRLDIELAADRFLPSGTGAIRKSSRTAKTQVDVRDNGTVVIAGLTREEDISTVRKVPFLGDIWLIGALFRRTETSKVKRNLCIFISPHIMTTDEELVAQTEARKKELEEFAEEEDVPISRELLEKVTGGEEEDKGGSE